MIVDKALANSQTQRVNEGGDTGWGWVERSSFLQLVHSHCGNRSVSTNNPYDSDNKH